MTTPIAIIGALDTKGADIAFVRAALEARGHSTLLIDTSVMGGAAFAADIRPEVLVAAAGSSLEELRETADRGRAIDVMAAGAAMVVGQLADKGKIAGIIGLGGSAGTAVATAAMRALPLGFPKVMVSTLAAGDTAAYVGSSDIVLVPSVVDVAGVNRISARVYANAVGAIAGMVETAEPVIEQRPLVAASMFGNTTELVNQCQSILAGDGFETLVFHATGTGGRTMESLIREGFFSGVLDLTTTELADELVGGVLSAGPERMHAAADLGVPQVIAPGCLDMVNFWGPETIPARFDGRRFYHWNPNVTLMRTTPDENAELGRLLAENANRSTGPVAIFLPLRGVSVLDSPGGEFWWPEANGALFAAIRSHVSASVPVVELDCNINDPAFARAATDQLMTFMSQA